MWFFKYNQSPSWITSRILISRIVARLWDGALVVLATTTSAAPIDKFDVPNAGESGNEGGRDDAINEDKAENVLKDDFPIFALVNRSRVLMLCLNFANLM